MAFDFVQIIVTGIPLVAKLPTGGVSSQKLEIRFTRSSRNQFLENPRGIYNADYSYAANDQVYYNGVFWRALLASGSPFAAVTPVEGTTWTQADKYDWAWPDPSKVFYLQKLGGYDGNVTGNGGIFVDVGRLSRYDAKDEGKLSPDRREVTLRDGITVSGVDGNGDPVTHDFSTDQYKSFLAWLFYNRTALTSWNFNRILSASTYDDVNAYECYWMGDSRNAANTGPDKHNLSGRTRFTRQISEKKIIIEGGINRLQSYTTKDIFPLYTNTWFDDGVGGHGPVQFVGGMLAGQKAYISSPGNLGINPNAVNPANAGTEKDWTGDSENNAAFGFQHVVFAVVPSNLGLHYMSFGKLFNAAATRAQMLWDSSKCSSPENAWTDYSVPAPNSGSGPAAITKTRRIDNGNIFDTTGFCAEAVLGSDPRCNFGVSELTTPVSLGWNLSWGDGFARYLPQFFCKLIFPIDQATKKQQLVFKSLQYLNTTADYGVTSTTLASAHVALGSGVVAGTLTVASGSLFLTAATEAIGEDAATYLTSGGTIFAQLQYQGIAQTLGVTAVSGNTITYSVKDDDIGFPVGAALNPVQLLPLYWEDGATVTSDAAEISAKYIELSTKGDTDTVQCTRAGLAMNGDPLPIQIAHNVKKYGPLNAAYVTLADITYDINKQLNQQRACWTPFTGGPNVPGSLLYAKSCTVQAGLGTIGIWNRTNIYSPDVDMRSLLSVNANDAGLDYTQHVINPGQGDLILFRDTISGAIGAGLVSNVFDHNTCEISVVNGTFQPQVGHPTDILVGYTTGNPSNTFNDIGWFFDATIGTVLGTPQNGVNTIVTNRVFVDGSGNIGTDIFNSSGTGNVGIGSYWIGMQIVLPEYGVFKITGVSADGHTLTLDKSIPNGATNVECRIGGPSISSDGWAFAAYLYYLNTSDERFHPYNYGPPRHYIDDFPNHEFTEFRNQSAAGPDYYQGAYTVSRLCVGLPEGQSDAGNITAPPDQYGVAHYSLAQAFAQKFIGIFDQPTRENVGIFGNDGSLTSWSNGDSYIEQRDGDIRCFTMEGHDLGEIREAGISIRSKEWQNFSKPLTAANYPVLIKGSGATAGGAGTGGGGGGGVGGNTGGGSTTAVSQTTISPSALTADTNNWSLSLPAGFVVIRMSSTADIKLTGLVPSTGLYEVKLINVGAFSITLTNVDTASAASNQFHASSPVAAGGAILIMPPSGTVTLFYDSDASALFWRILNVGGG